LVANSHERIGTLLCFPLPAVPRALVGDVAGVVRIETLRPTPLIVDGRMSAKPCRLLSHGINPLVYQSDQENTARDPWCSRPHGLSCL
jgi:hypothetical protein